MKAKGIIKKALSQGRSSLTEAESKAVLKEYGIPVVNETVVRNPAGAARAAKKIGFPVVIKGLGAKLTHKTEKGLVHLNLANSREVSRAAALISAAAGDDLEGFLVQPVVPGKRELVSGMFCDEQFGPVVMFGLGGVFTEALGDTAFRIAPLDEADARSMAREIRAQKILGPFRGEHEASGEDIVRVLTGLSRLAGELSDVTEVDVNPLIVTPGGGIVAVDALIIIGRRPDEAVKRLPVRARTIAGLFYPRSIAFIGASPSIGKWGHLLLTNVIAGGYRGKIYVINQKEKEIAGYPAYKSVLDVDGKIDLAVVTIPAKGVIDLIPQMREKRIRSMLLITSGFSETGDEGREMENRLVALAREAGITILGPNTMGICNPHESFYCTGTHVRPKAGSTALIAQSGNLGTQLLAFADEEGVGIRGFCGSGNEAMITIEDFIEGFEEDPFTKTIVFYIESIKNGRRFLDAARRIGRKKPIVILKGGRTSEGNKAAASHTGAMASNMKVYEAACRQAGVVIAEQPMDLLDLSAAFSYLPLPKGDRVAIVTIGGGWGVVATDLCIESGLRVPRLSDRIIAEIDTILPPYWSRSNPVDLVGEFNPAISLRVLEELVKWDECDAIVHLGVLGRMSYLNRIVDSAVKADPNYSWEKLESLPRGLAEYDRTIKEQIVSMMDKYGKPIIGVNLMADENTRIINAEGEGDYRCISFMTPERAVKSLARMFTYHRWRKETG
jgi:acyl-CoA synthetase (NDP forming)